MNGTDRDLCLLVKYALVHSLIKDEDRDYCLNRLAAVFRLPYVDGADGLDGLECVGDIDALLGRICDAARDGGIAPCTTSAERDLFDTYIMDIFLKRPSDFTEEFFGHYAKSPQDATDWFYETCKSVNYVRAGRIKNDLRWEYDSPAGMLEITVNLSKPEKDPRDIAAARNAKQSGYPKCQLCRENVGFSGNILQQARENLRIIPLRLGGEDWFLQYSPYAYYSEHCIVFNSRHTPMKIDMSTFGKLLDFLDMFPHYVIGSNADLPVVGGSILSHEHFQGGRHVFPLQNAGTEREFAIGGCPSVSASVVKWPMSVIRLMSHDREALSVACRRVNDAWRGYTDVKAGIIPETDGVRNSTVTPIAYMRDGAYCIDIVLRNNRTTPERPSGVFHPRDSLHHIKKENIGLIEVMGLAVLPSRLRSELSALGEHMTGDRVFADPLTEKHAAWAEEILSRRTVTEENVTDILREETGKVFYECLCDAGVFKEDAEGMEAFRAFTDTV